MKMIMCIVVKLTKVMITLVTITIKIKIKVTPIIKLLLTCTVIKTK